MAVRRSIALSKCDYYLQTHLVGDKAIHSFTSMYHYKAIRRKSYEKFRTANILTNIMLVSANLHTNTHEYASKHSIWIEWAMCVIIFNSKVHTQNLAVALSETLITNIFFIFLISWKFCYFCLQKITSNICFKNCVFGVKDICYA